MGPWPGFPNVSRPPDEDNHSHGHNLQKDMFHGLLKPGSRPLSPLPSKVRNSLSGGSQSGQAAAEPEPSAEDDPQLIKFRQLYNQSEAHIADLFDHVGEVVVQERKPHATEPGPVSLVVADETAPATAAPSVLPALVSKKRKLDDDDYDDYDDDEEEDAETQPSPLKGKSNKVQIVADATSSPVPRPVIPSRVASSDSGKAVQKEQPPKENAEDARKKLEAAKRAEIETVKTLSRTLFFTLENDRDAMLDQQRLDEAERRAEAEAEGHANRQNAAMQQGSLSSANLGASSLTLKNLIARIDHHRLKVNATDAEVRALLSEVRKNRSKWASEDKVGQEELYESAEKVLNELKAMTEQSTPFLNPVKKKDAPDYYQVIKTPMDLGTMTKKLKSYTYKSKKEFVDDLYQIWKNCLSYNRSPDHLFRKHALAMQKETDKLVPLIPEIVVRDRAEVEAEERRQRVAAGEIDEGAEESDDEPIMASRGRKAPKKSAKKGSQSARKAPPETTPTAETKAAANALASVSNGIRADSEVDGSQGHSTPPPGVLTPSFPHGPGSVIGAGSELLDSDLPPLPSAPLPVPEYEDEEYKLWKQKTKKDRAMIAAARHKLFRGDKLNAEEDALLRSKAGMRRWQKIQVEAAARDAAQEADESRKAQAQQGSLSEGLEAEEETMLPDYYDSLAAIPDLPPRLRWETDAQGQVIDQNEDYLHLLPERSFCAPDSALTRKIDSNIRQVQDTRKIVSKIGVVKQMQLQSQTYQNQFQKYNAERFRELDVEKHVLNDTGPVVATWVAQAALKRSVGKMFYHTGFEEFQPSAIEAMTDLAGEFLGRLCRSMCAYKGAQVTVGESVAEQMKQKYSVDDEVEQTQNQRLRPSMTNEEIILHSLHEVGLSLQEVDSYAREEIERLGTKTATMHERMKAHLADLLRPALSDDTAQGQGSFQDGGEQFVGGDFAEDLDEDFFGFRELGLDKEFGMANLTVPFHILHGRLNAANQNANVGTGEGEKLFKEQGKWPKVNIENVEDIVGVARNWFMKRLQENGERPLMEDYELPIKQRPGYGRARVPASGKIGGDVKKEVSPQKKLPMKPPPSKVSKERKEDEKKKGEKERKNSEAGKSNGVLGEGEIVINGVHDTDKDNATVDGDTTANEESPEKKRMVFKSKSSESGKDGGGDVVSNGAMPVKMNGVEGGQDGMMSPESL